VRGQEWVKAETGDQSVEEVLMKKWALGNEAGWMQHFAVNGDQVQQENPGGSQMVRSGCWAWNPVRLVVVEVWGSRSRPDLVRHMW
jgi:hypothetical protein